MQIFHRVALRLTKRDKKTLNDFGIQLSTETSASLISTDTIGVILIDDTDPRWPEIEAWAKQRRAVASTGTRFTQEEMDSADWFRLDINHHQGYPQPEADYFERTYDLETFCPECRAGAFQKAPFRMMGEPRWGRRGIMQLNWVFGEFFVRPDVWDTIFKAFDVAYRPVLNRGGKQLQTVVQLMAECEANVELDNPSICLECQRVSYPVHTRGFFPAFDIPPSGHFVKTKQGFGYGTPWHVVLISRTLRQSLIAHNILGASYWPVDNGSINKTPS